MEIYLIRHPQADVVQGICYGQSDVEITDESLKAALEKINKFIPDASELIVYSSELKRCKVIAENLRQKDDVIFSPDMREINFGRWEMKRWSEIPKNELNLWMSDFVNVNCYDGESYIDLYERVVMFWERLNKKNHKKVVVITHSGVIRAVLAHILQIPLRNSFTLKIDYCSISKILITDEINEIQYVNR